MIVAKTKMKKIPENCKKCSISYSNEFSGGVYDRVCRIKHRICPKEKKTSGNVGYGIPSWCPLMYIELIEEES